MPKLDNPKYERYAQARASGATHARAYAEMGGTGNPKKAGIYGYQLCARHPELRARIEEITQNRAEKAVEERLFTQTRVRELSKEHLERCMQTVPVRDSKGEPTGEYRYEAGQVTQMIKLVGQDTGMFNPVRKSQTSKADPLEGKTDDEVRALVRAAIDRIGHVSAVEGTSSEDSPGGEIPSGKPLRAVH